VNKEGGKKSLRHFEIHWRLVAAPKGLCGSSREQSGGAQNWSDFESFLVSKVLSQMAKGREGKGN